MRVRLARGPHLRGATETYELIIAEWGDSAHAQAVWSRPRCRLQPERIALHDQCALVSVDDDQIANKAGSMPRRGAARHGRQLCPLERVEVELPDFIFERSTGAWRPGVPAAKDVEVITVDG